MTKKFKLALLLIISTLSIRVWCQNVDSKEHGYSINTKLYEEGWVVTKSNDTLRGLIYTDFYVTPEYVLFKKSKVDKEETKYQPEDILAFHLLGYTYISKKLTIDISPTDYDAIKADPKQKTIVKSVFLKTQIKGKITLFLHKDSKDRLHFFAQKESDTTFYELTNRASIKKTSNGIIGLAYDNRYKGMLIFLMSDVTKIQPAINDTKFNSESIMDVVSEYDSAVKTDDKTYKVIHERFRLTTGIQIGLSNTTYSSLEYNFSKSSTPMLGVNFKYQFQKVKRLFIDSDVQYTYYDTKSYTTSSVNHEIALLKFGYVKFCSSVRLKILEGKFSPYLNLGLFFSIITHSSGKHTLYDNNNNIIYTVNSLYSDLFCFYSNGVYAGVGVAYGRLGLDVRYSRNNKIVKYYNTDSDSSPLKTESFEILLGYSFKGK